MERSLTLVRRSASPARAHSALTRSWTQVLSAKAAAAGSDSEDESDEDDDFCGVPNTHLGENMTAIAIPGRVLSAPKGLAQPPLPGARLEVILNFGIIDILQEYNLSKQIEHTWKARVRVCACAVHACDTDGAAADGCAAPGERLVCGPGCLLAAPAGLHEQDI